MAAGRAPVITLRAPQGAGGIQGAQSGGWGHLSQPPFSAGRLFPVLNLGESRVYFVKGGGIPLPAPPESLHLSRSLWGVSYTLVFVQSKRESCK